MIWDKDKWRSIRDRYIEKNEWWKNKQEMFLYRFVNYHQVNVKFLIFWKEKKNKQDINWWG